MSSIYHAALAASVLVGMLSIPAASQSMGEIDSVSGDLPNVSSSESTPKRVVTETDEDSFTRTVETAFQEFSTEISPGSVETSLENPGSRLEVDRSPGQTTWNLETSAGKLVVKQSPDRTVERTETPSGTLVLEEADGTVTTEFEGSNRSSVEEASRELRDLMEQKKQDIQEQRNRMKRNALPDVRIMANESTASGFGDNDAEHVVLVNRERSAVNLEGWTISDPASSHEFGSVTLESGERLRVYSGDVDAKVSETGIAWNDGGDTATLVDAAGRKIAEKTY